MTKRNIPSLLQKRAAAIDEAKAITDKAVSETRGMRSDEIARTRELREEIDSLTRQIKEQEEHEASMAATARPLGA